MGGVWILVKNTLSTHEWGGYRFWTLFWNFWSTVLGGKRRGHRFPPSLAKGMSFFLSNIYAFLTKLQ